MPSVLPDGEPVPEDGALPPGALAGAAARPLGFYLHVPYCATRCGYCDFNTYTAAELRGSGGVLASRDAYAELVAQEVGLARKVLGTTRGRWRPSSSAAAPHPPRRRRPRHDAGRRPGLLRARPDAEITTEANPESVDARYLDRLREAGFNRISFGMQSERQHVLRVLERNHTRAARRSAWRWRGPPGSSTSTWI
ncbi:radical SAM protein [Streptomyces sp. M19]